MLFLYRNSNLNTQLWDSNYYTAWDLCVSSCKLDGKVRDNVGYSMGHEYGKVNKPTHHEKHSC